MYYPKAPWMDVLWDHYRVTEISGPEDHPDIVKFHAAVDDTYTPDEVAWCSSCMCFAVEACGIRSPRSRAARSWLKWGVEVALDDVRVGDIAVFWRESRDSWMGHVAAVQYIDKKKGVVWATGGNQRNQLCTEAYRLSQVLSFRRWDP